MRRAPVSIEGLKPMTFSLKAGIALVALSGAAAVAGSATAADLGGARGGSMKDGGYMAPMPEIVKFPDAPEWLTVAPVVISTPQLLDVALVLVPMPVMFRSPVPVCETVPCPK